MFNFLKKQPKVGEIWFNNIEFSMDFGDDFEIVKIDKKGISIVNLKWKGSKLWGAPILKSLDVFLTCYKFNKEATLNNECSE